MTKLTGKRKNTIRNFVLMLAGTLTLGYLVAALTGSPIAADRGPFRPGDTPVVLVGGSLRFKAGRAAAGNAWQQVTQYKDYHYPANYKVKFIVVKISPDPHGDGPDGDDTNAATDKLRVDISNASSWQVDAYIATSTDPVASLKLAADGMIHLTGNGNLCPFGTPIKRIFYSTDCSSEAVKFSQINITVNNNPAGTLSCLDGMGDPLGQCKIVLRKN